MNRRRFFSTLLAAGAAAPALAQQRRRAATHRSPPSRRRRKHFRRRLHRGRGADGAQSVNRNLDSYDQLRKLNIPLDTEPAITFRPYLPGKRPNRARRPPARSSKLARPVVPANLTPEQIAFLPVTSLAVLIERKRITSTELTKMYLDRLKSTAHAEMRRHAHRRARARSRRPTPMRRSRPASIAVRCTAFPGARRICSRRRASRRRGARHPITDQVIDFDATVVERLRDAGAVLVAKLSMGALAQGDGGSAASPAIPGCRTSSAARADRPRVPARRPRPVWSASRSAPKRSARSSRRRRATASSACVRRTAASAATARWRCRGRWTRSARCVGRSKTACWC